MSKVTFRSKQPYFQLSYMDVFNVGFITVPVVGGKPYKDNIGNPNIDYAKCEELGIKDPDSVGSGYLFREREQITMRLRWRMRMLLRVLEPILHPEMIILL